MKTDFQTGSTTAYIPLTRVFTPEKISFVIVVFMAKKSCFLTPKAYLDFWSVRDNAN